MNIAAVGGKAEGGRGGGGHLRLGGEQGRGQALAIGFPGSGSQSSTFCGEN